MKHVLLVDNFDSFTFNLYQYLGELADTVTVVRNNEIPFDGIQNDDFTHLVISPGPGDPTDPDYFGDCWQLIDAFHTKYPILGICLGHQGIGAYFGGIVTKAPQVMHGKVSEISHAQGGLLRDLPSPLAAMRYHSLIVKDLPDELIVDATSDDGSIMAFHHQSYLVYGLQFHPESFATPEGKAMLLHYLDEPSNS